MAKSPEMLWLDAIEANESGNRDEALSLAEEVVSIDENHSDAWMGVAQWILPADSRGRQLMPDLAQASKSMSALRRVVDLNPDNEHAWRLGGEIIVGHLGMLEDGLKWWQRRKEIAPSDISPYFEQAFILISMGYFDRAEECLDEMDSIVAKQPSKPLEARARRLREIFMEEAKLEGEVGFEPQNGSDESWGLITRMSGKKPITETYFLIMFVMPIVFLLGTLSMYLFSGVRFGTGIVMILIIVMYFWIAKISRGLLLKVNRPEKFLNRALDHESTTGKVCIPDDLRSSKLYAHLMKSRMPAFKQRLGLIEDSGEKLPGNWELKIPF